MPNVQSDSTTIALIIPKSGKKALEIMTEREDMKSVSELIRRLLTNYCRGNGLDVDFGIGSWGGNRRGKLELLKSQQADPDRFPVAVAFSDDKLRVTLADGSEIATPLAWYPFLESATPEQRANVIIGGLSLEWPDLDEGLSIDGMLKGPNERIKAHLAAR